MCVGLQADAPACGYYAATFEGLFAALVHRRARVVEVACEAQGAPACVFEVRW
jgi:divinyl protochlorophyllide a 8-vinyl-reductase